MNLFNSPQFKKVAGFALADTLLTFFAVIMAFSLRFDGNIPYEYLSRLWVFCAMLAAANLFFIWRERLYAFTWSFVGLQDLTRLVRALTYASTVFAIVIFLDLGTTNYFTGFPRSVILISYFLNLLFIGSLRIAKRLWHEVVKKSGAEDGAKTIVIGAGPEAERLVRNLQNSESKHYFIFGLLDEKPDKQKTLIHGIPVLGDLSRLGKITDENQIQQVIIALPSGDSTSIKKAVRYARDAGIQNIKVIPPFAEIIEKKIAFEELKDVSIEDLLGREPAKLETDEIKSSLAGKRVLVTGAAGSIGAELARQIARFEPEDLILLDVNESGVFDLENELKISFPEQKFSPVVANITNAKKINQVFEEKSPQTVFHAAAYKHVPLMENFPEEAIITNIFGTLCLAETAKKHGAKKFVLISTDKAVRPISIMGKTKRVAEAIVNSLNGEGPTRFVSVRFGNVLASRGSVVPLFQEQIKRRSAVTVTHPEMTRYFMTIPEAALLVMEAGAVGRGGEVFLLDMGKPVKIVDLARELIKLSGFEPDRDIPIVYTGVRPGEKIVEVLLTDEEDSLATKWEKIFVSKTSNNVNMKFIKDSMLALNEKLGNRESLTKELDGLIKEIESAYSPTRKQVHEV